MLRKVPVIKASSHKWKFVLKSASDCSIISKVIIITVCVHSLHFAFCSELQFVRYMQMLYFLNQDMLQVFVHPSKVIVV
jgi:hypothetical protein